jgi:hypothetical protein
MLTDEQRSTVVAAICIAVLVTLASLASWSGTIVGSSSPTAIEQSPVQTGQYRNQDQSSNEDETSPIIAALSAIDAFITRYKDDIGAISTFFIMVFTGILGWFTVSLARSTRIAAQHIPRVERAYVFLHPDIGYAGPLWAAGVINIRAIKITFSLRNQGKTPAIIRRINVELGVFNSTPSLSDRLRTLFRLASLLAARKRVMNFRCSAKLAPMIGTMLALKSVCCCFWGR